MKKIFGVYCSLFMGACVWTNNGNVRERKKGKEERKRGVNKKMTRGEHWKKNRDGLIT